MQALSDKIVFINKLKQSKSKNIKLKLIQNEYRDKDFSSYQYMFGEFEVTGIIINSTQYHILIQVAFNNLITDFRYVRLLDIESYEIE